ncbi:MAG: CC0125/CC1285 family lipoprotein [Geminicoccaceae bacterium]
MTLQIQRLGKTWLLPALILSMVGACAVPTPYQAAEKGYGYSDQRIEDNRYQLSFAGNSSTPRETVESYLLYRAAEVTIENGFDYFTIVQRDTERSTRYYYQSYYDDFGYYSSRRRRGYGRYVGPSYSSGTSYPISEYSSTADVLMFEGDKPADDVNAYDALDVLQRLKNVVLAPSPQE